MKTITFEVDDKKHNLFILDDYLSMDCAKNIITGKSYPFPEWFGKQHQQPKVVIDIGGHVGEFAAMARINWPKAEIHVFEPNPEVIPVLKLNAEIYDFKIYQMAVSDKGGTTDLCISGYGSVANSIVDRPNQTGEKVTVNVADAKDLMRLKPNVLKVDAEGVEVQILGRMDLPSIELIYLEFHSEGDRLTIEQMLRPTHSLFHANIGHKDQGELMYVRRKTNL